MTYRKESTRLLEIYGISGAKGHGKDTFCNLVLQNSIGKSFDVLHFADDLKRMASRIFSIPLECFIDPSKKEIPFDIPLELDLFVPAMSLETGLKIVPLGFIAKSPRDVMQLFGTEYVRGIQDDYWIGRTIDKISSKKVLIPDTRFVKEANGIRSVNGRIIEVIRIDLPDSGDLHSSETERSLIKPDLVIGVRTGDLSLPIRVAKLIAMGKFNSAKRYDYRAARKAILEYQSGNSLENSAKLLGENHKDPYCLKNILEYYGVPIRRQNSTRVAHKICDNIPYKWCGACSDWKILGEFNSNSRGWDGLAGLCRLCASQRNKSKYLMYSKVDTLRRIFTKSQQSARYRGIEFDISLETLENIFTKQNGKCFYSGHTLEFEPGTRNKLTLDRIDSSKGYTHDNVVLCSYVVNIMKGSMSVNEFADIIIDLSKKSDSWEFRE
jgi:hypothetical protein